MHPVAIVADKASWFAINDSNQAAGFAYVGSGLAPLRWDSGVTTTLSSGGPGTGGGAFAIDNAGDLFGAVVNGATNAGVPAYWSPTGTLTTISAAAGLLDSLNVRIRAASDNGNVVGVTSNASTHNAVEWFAALQPAYAPVPLGAIVGISTAAINDAGNIAIGNAAAPYLLVNGAHHPLKVSINTGFDLNNNGDVAGTLVSTPGSPSSGAAIEFANGTVQDLPPLHPGDSVTVNALNDHDEAVGSEDTSSGYLTAVAWIDGKVVPAASLVAGNFSGSFEQALDVNNNGSILTQTQSNFYLLEASASPLSIALTGERGRANSVGITMTVTNTGSTDISGVSFTDPKGLENNGVLLKGGNIGPTQSGLTLTEGPTPNLPTTLTANGPPVVLHYTYTATSAGDAVLVANASGTDGDGKTVTAKAAVTVYVANPAASEADYDKLVTSVLLATDSITSAGQNSLATTEANSLATGLKLGVASPGQQQSAVAVGLPTQMGVLVGTSKDSALSQWVGNYATILSGDLKAGVSSLGTAGEALASQLLFTATDPEARAAALGRLWDGIESLPAETRAALASQSDNLGYAGDALAASLTPSGLATGARDTAAAGASVLNHLQNDVKLAVNGFPAMVAADTASYNKDPSAFINAESKQYADATYGLIKTEVITVLGEGVLSGIGSAKASYGALSRAEVDSAVTAAVDSTAPAAADSTAALMQKADVATSQFQTLPAGTTLAADQAAALGGLVPGDQVGVQKALKYIADNFGVQLEIGVRTSEPLSVGINGSPKLSFMKPKAVSAIDMLIGAPEEIAAYTGPGEAVNKQVFNGGVTTVFNPVPIPPAELAAIAETNPGFVSSYTSRLASQQKLWAEYQDANSTLRVLVKGSAEGDGGVTAIANVPGFPVPPPPVGAQPLVYLEQLDQSAFRIQFGLTTEQAEALKASLADSPGAVKVDYIARPNGDGSISFFDGLNSNRPIVSDLDLQYVRPANGAAWPAGKQSQIELAFENQLEQNVSRLPNHGASGTASDLPAADIGVADAFVMSTADPAFADAVAANLARRYASQTAIFSANADRLEALAAQTSDGARATALRAQATIYRQIAAKFSQIDAAYLLAKYPPGEKIIVIKLGDVRVGYGPAPKA